MTIHHVFITSIVVAVFFMFATMLFSHKERGDFGPWIIACFLMGCFFGIVVLIPLTVLYLLSN